MLRQTSTNPTTKTSLFFHVQQQVFDHQQSTREPSSHTKHSVRNPQRDPCRSPSHIRGTSGRVTDSYGEVHRQIQNPKMHQQFQSRPPSEEPHATAPRKRFIHQPRPHRRGRRKRRRRFDKYSRHRLQPILLHHHPSSTTSTTTTSSLPATITIATITASVSSPGLERQAHLRSFRTPPVGNPRQRRQRPGPAARRAVPLPPLAERLRDEALRRLGQAGEGARPEPRGDDRLLLPAGEDLS